MFWEPGSNILPAFCRMAALPYPAYGLDTFVQHLRLFL
jgi:hypothetical protein